jgi:5,10-methylenetetrahydromethanopterin reductase
MARIDSATAELFDKFGTYILPGRIADSKRGIEEAKEAERLGLGSVWISERYASKEPAVLSGAVGQATSTIRIAGTFYCTMRNPIVTASIADVMQSLSGGRYRLMFARAVPEYLRLWGSPPITFQRLADVISICRRLWAGETVSYEGILGKFAALKLNDRHGGVPAPIFITAIGPKALEFGGTYCDGVLLHPFVTPYGVENSVKIVREAAERAGRDPASVRICCTVIVAPNLPKDEEDAVVAGRAVTYFDLRGLGEMLVTVNGWQPDILFNLRSHPKIAELKGRPADLAFTRQELIEVSRTLPRHWLEDGAVVGTPAKCAAALTRFLSAGANEIVLHGCAPMDIAPVATQLKRLLARKAVPTSP